MGTQIIVRQAKRQDIAAIVELWKEFMAFHRENDSLFTQAPNAEDVFARFVEGNIESETARAFVAVADGRLVGCCQGKLEKYPPVIAEQDYGQILDVAVTTEYRRAGIGERMIKALHDWFCGKGVHRIEVRCWMSNEIGCRFWRKMGFETCMETLFMRC